MDEACGLERMKPFMTAQLWMTALLLSASTAWAQTPGASPPLASLPAPPLVALPSLDVPTYMGTWYQVAWFPNRFQSQCVSDTAATYRQLEGGRVEVINRCRRADGSLDDVTGLARPAGAALLGNQLQPAQLEVSFLPKALRWLPIWGSYWVIQLAEDGRYAVVSEAQRKYLWVLSRTPKLLAADETEIRSRLVQQGFDLARWQTHPHTVLASAPR